MSKLRADTDRVVLAAAPLLQILRARLLDIYGREPIAMSILRGRAVIDFEPSRLDRGEVAVLFGNMRGAYSSGQIGLIEGYAHAIRGILGPNGSRPAGTMLRADTGEELDLVRTELLAAGVTIRFTPEAANEETVQVTLTTVSE